MRSELAWAHLGLSALLVLWDILLAGRIARTRGAPEGFAAVSALCGLLIAPALLVMLATTSGVYGRTLQTVSWVWPLTVALFAAQAVYATARRLVTPLVSAPIAVYNLILAVGALISYVLARGVEVSDPLLMLRSAQGASLTIAAGPLALWSPLFLHVPIMSPAFAARWRVSATARGTVAVVAAAWVVLIAVELRTGRRAIHSYAPYGAVQMQERDGDSLVVGLRLLPEVSGAPSPYLLRQDLALAETLGVRAVQVEVDPAGASRAALDSLARSLEQLRRAGAVLIVTLGYPGELDEYVGRRRAFRAEMRLDAIERIARRLRPDYIVAAADPFGTGARAVGRRPPAEWQEYLTRAAQRAGEVNRRIRVGVSLSPYTLSDSALYQWAASPSSPLGVVGFALYPGRMGARTLDVGRRTVDRWMRSARSGKEHWVFAAGAFTDMHGERNQELALLGTLAWAAGQERIRGVVISSAGDYGAAIGLRAPSGRLRPAVASLRSVAVTP